MSLWAAQQGVVMTAMVWWLIPLLSCIAAYLWTRTSLARRQPTRPLPGTPQDAADLARFAAALRQPLPTPESAPESAPGSAPAEQRAQ